MAHPLHIALTQVGVFTSRPAFFAVPILFMIGWGYFEPETLDWHGFATLATWMMTLFIQRASHRDTQAIHAKLDEILDAQEGASGRLSKVDDREPEEIEKIREQRVQPSA